MALGEGDAEQAERLLARRVLVGRTCRPRSSAPAQRASDAWVGAHDGAGRLVAMARAVCDGRHAWIYDVVVAQDLRGRGLGARIGGSCSTIPPCGARPYVWLRTRDGQGFYERLGFVDAALRRRWPTSTQMVLERAAADAPVRSPPGRR